MLGIILYRAVLMLYWTGMIINMESVNQLIRLNYIRLQWKNYKHIFTVNYFTITIVKKRKTRFQQNVHKRKCKQDAK